MKTTFQFFLLTLAILALSLLISCTSNTNKKNTISTLSEINPPVANDKGKKKIGKDIIFSTKDLETAKTYLPDEYPLKVVSENGVVETNSDYVIPLGDYNEFKVIICEVEGGDYFMDYLYVEKLGRIISNKCLSLSPYWGEPEGEGDYKKIYFEISSNYLIRIDTEEKTDGKIKKYTNYYRISDEGEFYEVKK